MDLLFPSPSLVGAARPLAVMAVSLGCWLPWPTQREWSLSYPSRPMSWGSHHIASEPGGVCAGSGPFPWMPGLSKNPTWVSLVSPCLPCLRGIQHYLGRPPLGWRRVAPGLLSTARVGRWMSGLWGLVSFGGPCFVPGVGVEGQ